MEKTKTERRIDRDQQVRIFFEKLEKKHPQLRLNALLEKTAERFPPISTGTVSLIINKGGNYK
jgi:hypothetical protein